VQNPWLSKANIIVPYVFSLISKILKAIDQYFSLEVFVFHSCGKFGVGNIADNYRKMKGGNNECELDSKRFKVFYSDSIDHGYLIINLLV
jgi:hypothetical protein